VGRDRLTLFPALKEPFRPGIIGALPKLKPVVLFSSGVSAVGVRPVGERVPSCYVAAKKDRCLIIDHHECIGISRIPCRLLSRWTVWYAW
jgi:hypothetical protein